MHTFKATFFQLFFKDVQYAREARSSLNFLFVFLFFNPLLSITVEVNKHGRLSDLSHPIVFFALSLCYLAGPCIKTHRQTYEFAWPQFLGRLLRRKATKGNPKTWYLVINPSAIFRLHYQLHLFFVRTIPFFFFIVAGVNCFSSYSFAACQGIS